MTNTRKVITLAAAIGIFAIAFGATNRLVDVKIASLDTPASQPMLEESGPADNMLVGEKSLPMFVDTPTNTPVSPEQFASTANAWLPEANSVAVNEQFGPAINKVNHRDAESQSAGTAPRDKMSGPVAAIAALGGSGMVEIIVRYDQHPELFDDARVAELGGEVTRSYEVLDMRAISIPVAELENFAGEENVDWLSLNDEIFSASVSSRVAAGVPSGKSSNEPYTGVGVGVAVLDTGMAKHDDLESDFMQYSFVGEAYPTPTFHQSGEIDSYNDTGRDDGFGHGTHVAGILTGKGSDSDGMYKGTSRKASLLSLQVMAANGSGSISDVMAGIDWLLAYGSHFDIRVVNLSLGKAVTESNKTDPLVLAVERLWDAGYVVVVAAGNYGYYGNLTITSPANSRKVITVGALTDNGTGSNYEDDYVSSFSSLGPTFGDYVVKPDLVAPGNRLIAAIPDNALLADFLPERVVSCTASDCDSVYLELSGTSMAAPMVSAAVALMLEKDPSLTPATIKARLMRSARKIDTNFVSSGAGLLDVDAAMNEFGVISGQALSPLMFDDAATGGLVVEDTADLWGDSIWGTGYIFTDGETWTSGFAWTDGDGVTSSGFAWTDGGGVGASGFGWTDGDGVSANGFGWTDGGVSAAGFGWTEFVGAQSLLVPDGTGMALHDDANE